MGMVETLKQISKTTGEAGAPMQIMFGTVTSENPLAVLVENRLQISGEMLIVPKHLRAGYLDTHKHRITAGDLVEEWTDEEENTEYYYGLKAGEAVILLRDAGGQRFLIVGRL